MYPMYHQDECHSVCPHFYADAVIDNTRYASLKFDIKQDAVLHGFAGYFDTVLYDNVNLSKSLSSIES